PLGHGIAPVLLIDNHVRDGAFVHGFDLTQASSPMTFAAQPWLGSVPRRPKPRYRAGKTAATRFTKTGRTR
ncbi:MAG: hypothetical protein AAFW98_13945, partial [Pseudomonadota bacterium]